SKLDMLQRTRPEGTSLNLAEQLGKVPRARGTGEGHDVRPAACILHQRTQAGTRLLGHDGFVSFDHIDFGTGRAQLLWNHVARDFGSYEHHAFAADLIAQSLHHRLPTKSLGTNLTFRPCFTIAFFVAGPMAAIWRCLRARRVMRSFPTRSHMASTPLALVRISQS